MAREEHNLFSVFDTLSIPITEKRVFPTVVRPVRKQTLKDLPYFLTVNGIL